MSPFFAFTHYKSFNSIHWLMTRPLNLHLKVNKTFQFSRSGFRNQPPQQPIEPSNDYDQFGSIKRSGKYCRAMRAGTDEVKLALIISILISETPSYKLHLLYFIQETLAQVIFNSSQVFFLFLTWEIQSISSRTFCIINLKLSFCKESGFRTVFKIHIYWHYNFTSLLVISTTFFKHFILRKSVSNMEWSSFTNVVSEISISGSATLKDWGSDDLWLGIKTGTTLLFLLGFASFCFGFRNGEVTLPFLLDFGRFLWL